MCLKDDGSIKILFIQCVMAKFLERLSLNDSLLFRPEVNGYGLPDHSCTLPGNFIARHRRNTEPI